MLPRCPTRAIGPTDRECGQPAKLPGLDSNQECQDQNLVCYRLHHRVFARTAGRSRTSAEPANHTDLVTQQYRGRGCGPARRPEPPAAGSGGPLCAPTAADAHTPLASGHIPAVTTTGTDNVPKSRGNVNGPARAAAPGSGVSLAPAHRARSKLGAIANSMPCGIGPHPVDPASRQNAQRRDVAPVTCCSRSRGGGSTFRPTASDRSWRRG